MSHKPRRALRIVAILFAILVVLVGGAAIVLQRTLTPERLRTNVESAVHDATGLATELTDVRLSWMPLGISLEGLRILGAEAGDPAFLELQSGLMQLDLGALVGRRVVVKRIVLDSPQVALQKIDKVIQLPGKLGAPAQDAGGAEARETGGAVPAAVSQVSGAIERFEIRNGAVRITTADGAEDLTLDGLDLSGRLDIEAGGQRASSAGELSLASLDLPAQPELRPTLDRLRPVVRYQLTYVDAEDRVVFEDLQVSAADLDLRAGGSIDQLSVEPLAHLEFPEQSLDLAKLLALVPPETFPEGAAPTAQGNVQVAGALDVSARRAAGEGLQIALPGGAFRIDGTVEGLDSERPNFSGAVKGQINLTELGQTGLLPAAGEASGQVEIDVSAQGIVGDSTTTLVDGTAQLREASFRGPEMPVAVSAVSADLAFEGRDAVLQNLSGSLGRSTFEVKGRVANALTTPHAHIEGRVPRLDATEWVPAADGVAATNADGDVVADGSLAGAAEPPPLIPELPTIPVDAAVVIDTLITVGATYEDVTMTAKVRDARANVEAQVARGDFDGVALHGLNATLALVGQTAEGTFRAPRVDAHGVPLTNVRGNLSLDDARLLAIRDVTAAVWTGTLAGDALIDLTDPESPAFEIRSEGRQLEANDFLTALTPADDFLQGKLDINSSFSGRGALPDSILPTLLGNGDVKVSEGSLRRGPAIDEIWNALQLQGRESIDFRDLLTAFTIEDGQLVTKDLLLEGGNATWRANGSLGFDGQLNYDVEVELNEELSNHYRQKLSGPVAALLAGGSGRIVVDLKVRGPAAKPQVDADMEKLAKRARDNAADAIGEDLKDLGDKVRDGLGGGLRDLLGGKKK